MIIVRETKVSKVEFYYKVFWSCLCVFFCASFIVCLDAWYVGLRSFPVNDIVMILVCLITLRWFHDPYIRFVSYDDGVRDEF